MLLALLALLGCGAPAPEPTPATPRAWTPSAAPDALRVYQPSGPGVPLALQFTDIGPAYQAVFSEPERLQPLSEALAGCVGGTPSLALSYDQARQDGRIVLVIPAHQLRCGVRADADEVDLSPLVPLARAVAAWRNDLAAWRDIRFYAFRTGVHVEDRAGAVTVWLYGQDPVDGSAFHPCIGLDGVERCVAAERDTPDGVLRLPLPAAEARRVRALAGGEG